MITKCCKCHSEIPLEIDSCKLFEGKPYCLDCWNIGNPNIEPLNTKYEEAAIKIGQLVDKKNDAYGDSFNKCGEFLKILYPNGVKPEQYTDLLGVTRVFDKLMRIANKKDAFGESPWKDIAGYAILRSGTNE